MPSSFEYKPRSRGERRGGSWKKYRHTLAALSISLRNLFNL